MPVALSDLLCGLGPILRLVVSGSQGQEHEHDVLRLVSPLGVRNVQVPSEFFYHCRCPGWVFLGLRDSRLER